MFKRLRNKKENEKTATVPAANDVAKPSPSSTSSPNKFFSFGSGNNSQVDTDADAGAQGFICPLCMKALTSPEALQAHFDKEHAEGQAKPEESQGEGFLCPICKKSLPSPEELQAHFDSAHDDDKPAFSENRDGDVLAMRQEIDDLRTSLKEERWYTEQLKKELEKTAEPGTTPNIPLSAQERAELEMCRLQLRGSEESRTLLSSEVHHLQSKIAELTANSENVTTKAVNESYESDINRLTSQLETEKQERRKEVSELLEAKEILISQKLEIQNQRKELEEKMDKIEQGKEEAESKAVESQMVLREENSGLQNKLIEEQRRGSDIQRSLDEERAKYELQSTVLNENLTTIRGDLVTAQQSVEDLTKANDELSGEKLELEAKLENNNDERRILLERCLKSEEEGQRLREKATEFRRKFDDTQAALQELGRENQSLQITTTKVQSRKWTDDNEVKECMSCNKGFSVTVRRHHCRNCGNIYCQECSAHNAKLPSFKKPQRVCDNCFIEINKR